MLSSAEKDSAIATHRRSSFLILMRDRKACGTMRLICASLTSKACRHRFWCSVKRARSSGSSSSSKSCTSRPHCSSTECCLTISAILSELWPSRSKPFLYNQSSSNLNPNTLYDGFFCRGFLALAVDMAVRVQLCVFCVRNRLGGSMDVASRNQTRV